MVSNNWLQLALMVLFLAASVQAQTPPPASNNNTGGPPKTSLPARPGAPNFADAQPEDITNENYPELIESFDYPNADIQEVVKAISKLTGKNFILEDNVRGKITIIAPTQITVAEAYRAFLSALAINGLSVVPSGKFLLIRQARAAMRDSIETYAGNYFPNTPQLITRILKLKYISAEEVHKHLRQLQSKDGEINPYPPTNSLIISDYGSSVQRIEEILKELDVPGFEEQLAVIRIRYARAKDIADLIDQIINKGDGPRGSTRTGVPRFRPVTPGVTPTTGGTGAESYSLVVPDERTNSIIVVGNAAGIEKIKSLVAKLDFKLRPEDAGGVYVYYVRNGEAEQIANVLNGIAEESRRQQQQPSGPSTGALGAIGGPMSSQSAAVFGGDVKVTADKVTNSLIITASKVDYDVVKTILAKIDIPRDQVFVKAVIMELNSQKSTEWGMNVYKFNPDSNGIGRAGFASSPIESLFDPRKDSGAVLGFGSSNTFELKSPTGQSVTIPDLVGLIRFLKKNVGANILSTPQIMALDNEQAVIEVGETIPVGKSDATTGSTVTTSIQREKATIKLDITPYISPDSDTVRLKIDQQVKQASKRQVQATELADASVVTNDRNVKTMIVVDSGDTAVIGGLMSDKEDEEVVKVPILGDIPILGWLFKGKTVTKEKSNLLVFITPKIIRNTRDNSDLLNAKLNERIEFVQRSFNGRDPYGYEIDALPRKAVNDSGSMGTEPMEEPATETF